MEDKVRRSVSAFDLWSLWGVVAGVKELQTHFIAFGGTQHTTGTMVLETTPTTTTIPINETRKWKILLQERGWCILEVPVSFWKHQYGSSADHREWLDHPSSWQTLHRQLFTAGGGDGGTARYVGAECGGGVRNEPKQSWELQRSNKTTHTNNGVDRPLRAVLDLLHAVAVHVNDTCFDTDISKRLIYGDGDGDECSTQPFDLLRAFCYEPTDDNDAMGSTPHTDWGSFTVVWQDAVGGLQTYQEGEWMPVPCEAPSSSADNAVRLVVHVGDITSLVTGYPSPLHRVVSPRTQHRYSFVYFLYPVPHATLRELHKCHGNGAIDEDDTHYEHYSLLQDQSSVRNQSSMTARDRYEAILDQKLADVFRRKWDQVQR